MLAFNDSDAALIELARVLREHNYSFSTVTPTTHARVNARKSNEEARDLRGVFGWSRPFRVEILPPELWRLMQSANIARPHGELWKSLLRASTLNRQLFFHSAYPTNAEDSVFFGPDTVRFVLALEAFLQQTSRIERALDVGCGAGPGVISIAVARPDAQVFGVDINANALRLTRINAAIAGAHNVEARHSNLLANVEGDFDLIVANPPYLVDASERTYRHGGGPLGAGLSLAIVESALQRLTVDGTLLLYTGAAMINGCDPFREAVEEKLRAANASWQYSEIDPDIFGEELDGGAYGECDRIAAVVLLARRL